jgi:hypothetical protein
MIEHIKAVVADQSGDRDSGDVAHVDSLAKVAREHSWQSRTFALFFGEADALAATIEPEKIRTPPKIQLLPVRLCLSEIQTSKRNPAA